MKVLKISMVGPLGKPSNPPEVHSFFFIDFNSLTILQKVICQARIFLLISDKNKNSPIMYRNIINFDVEKLEIFFRIKSLCKLYNNSFPYLSSYFKISNLIRKKNYVVRLCWKKVHFHSTLL